MSLVIRLSNAGRKGERKYKVVVKEKRSKRDGKAVAILGSYEKRVSGVTKTIDKKLVDYWVSKGAQLSEGVKKIL